jgi:predicted nuclease of predicted toxin-antitoxin system
LRFLVDNTLSPVVVEKLWKAGYEAPHVRDRSMQAATDEEVCELAVQEDWR